MAKARQKVRSRPSNAYGKLVTLSSYAMTKEETEIILGTSWPKRSRTTSMPQSQPGERLLPSQAKHDSQSKGMPTATVMCSKSASPGTEVVLRPLTILGSTRRTGVLVG